MSRKKKHEEHENHERWLVSYADFITLLFAFFVVMYSISSVNEGKYRVLSESLVAAFRTSARSLQPVQVGGLARSPRNTSAAPMQLPMPMNFTPIVIDNDFTQQPTGTSQDISENAWAMDEAAQQVQAIAEEVESSIQNLLNSDMISLRRNRLWLEIELRTNFLFGSASAEPSIDAEVILGQLGKVMRDFPNRLLVEGFTDNQTIKGGMYPSNWELSSARAAAVVRLFERAGVQPERMASVGYGEHRPIASNESEAGRIQNRRVVIVVISNLDNKPGEASVTSFELLKQKLRQSPMLVD